MTPRLSRSKSSRQLETALSSARSETCHPTTNNSTRATTNNSSHYTSTPLQEFYAYRLGLAGPSGSLSRFPLRLYHAVLKSQNGYFAAFFCAAQRRLTASAIRARPSGDRFRFFFVFAVGVTAVGKAFSALRGRPAFREAAIPVESAFNSWRASFRVAISASSNARTSLIAIARIIPRRLKAPSIAYSPRLSFTTMISSCSKPR